MDLEKKFGYIIIKGKYYLGELDKNDKPTLKLQKKADVNAKIKKAREISTKLKSYLDSEAVLMESTMKLEPEEFDTLYKMLFKSKKNYKPTTRKHHCVDMKVGKFVLPIVD